MSDRSTEFDTFLREWVAKRIFSLGDRVDPGDQELIIQRRASELIALAREKGSHGLLFAQVGNVADHIRPQHESAETDKRERDIDANSSIKTL